MKIENIPTTAESCLLPLEDLSPGSHFLLLLTKSLRDPFLRVLYKENRIVCTPFSLAACALHAFEIPPWSRVECVSNSFLFIAEWYSPFEIITLVDPFTCWHTSGKFSVWAIMNKAVKNIHVRAFLWKYVSISLGYLLRGGITGS